MDEYINDVQCLLTINDYGRSFDHKINHNDGSKSRKIRVRRLFFSLSQFFLVIAAIDVIPLVPIKRSTKKKIASFFSTWLIELQWHNINNNQSVHLMLLQYRQYCACITTTIATTIII